MTRRKKSSQEEERVCHPSRSLDPEQRFCSCIAEECDEREARFKIDDETEEG